MSQARVEAVRAMYSAFGAGDIPTIIATLDPQVQWWEAESFIYADQNPYVGPNAVLEGVFMRIGSEWDGFAVTPENVLDAGDTIQGTPLATYYAKQEPITSTGEKHPMARAMNVLHYDAVTLGNHEFNYGLDFLAGCLEGAEFPFVSANATKSDEPPHLSGKAISSPSSFVVSWAGR